MKKDRKTSQADRSCLRELKKLVKKKIKRFFRIINPGP